MARSRQERLRELRDIRNKKRGATKKLKDFNKGQFGVPSNKDIDAKVDLEEDLNEIKNEESALRDTIAAQNKRDRDARLQAARDKRAGRKPRSGNRSAMASAVQQASEFREKQRKQEGRPTIVDASVDAQGNIDTSGLEDNTFVRTAKGDFKKFDSETGGLTDVEFDPMSDGFKLPEAATARGRATSGTSVAGAQDFTRTQLTELRTLGQTDERFAKVFQDFQTRQIEIMQDPNLRPEERETAMAELNAEIGQSYQATSGYRREIAAAAAEKQRLEEVAAADTRLAQQREKVDVERMKYREAANDRAEARRKEDASADSALLQSLDKGYDSYVADLNKRNEEAMTMNPEPALDFDSWRRQQMSRTFETKRLQNAMRGIEDRQVEIEQSRSMIQDQIRQMPDFVISLTGKGLSLQEAQNYAQRERDALLAMDSAHQVELQSLNDRRREVEIENAMGYYSPELEQGDMSKAAQAKPMTDYERQSYNTNRQDVKGTELSFPRNASREQLERFGYNSSVLDAVESVQNAVMSGRSDIDARENLTQQLSYAFNYKGRTNLDNALRAIHRELGHEGPTMPPPSIGLAAARRMAELIRNGAIATKSEKRGRLAVNAMKAASLTKPF